MSANVERSASAPASRTSGGAALVEGIDRGIGRALELLCAALVVVETLLLFVGVIARYVVHRPLVWSDELASTIFLWLGMLGAALAIRRSENLRMNTVVNRLPATLRAYAEPFTLAVTLAFIVMLLPAAIEHVKLEAIVITPTLEISSSWRAAAMPAGLVLMALFVVVRMVGQPLRLTLVMLAVVVVACGVFYLARPYLLGLGRVNLVIFFLGVVPFTVFAGLPIAFSFGVATFGYLAVATHMPTSVVVARLEAGMSNLILLSIPLFVFLGYLLEITGMAACMIRFLASLLGHVKNGLHYVLVAAMYLVSGISGSKAADMAAVAPALFPEMEKRGADRAELAALLAATGAQTETVPPSLILIAIGSVTGISIAALFQGGLLPALVVGLMLCGLVWFRSRGADVSLSGRATGREIWRALLIAFPALLLPFVIRSAVIEGVATATEVSTIGIAYSLVVGALVYECKWSQMGRVLVQSASLSGAILIVVGAATAMAWAITQSGFSQALAAAISGMPGGRFTFIALSILLFAVLGCVLEGLPAVVLFAPLMFPIAKQFGVHEVHYSVIAILAMGVGLFTPPFGIGFYITCAIGGADPDKAIHHIWTYLAVLLVGVILVAAVPWLSVGFL
jgi:tripartite ATP-independent transporter DctM subunit